MDTGEKRLIGGSSTPGCCGLCIPSFSELCLKVQIGTLSIAYLKKMFAKRSEVMDSFIAYIRTALSFQLQKFEFNSWGDGTVYFKI